MITTLAVVVGGLLVVIVVADVFRTVLWSGQGAGPLTGAITGLGRRLLPHLPSRGRVRSAVGPVAILAIVSLWAGLLLVGFTLLFEADPDAIRTSTAERPVDWSERAYYVGYSLFSLGNGDLAPVTDFGRVLTVATTATGLFLITLSVTYLLPVVSASVASRAFASSALSLGDTPEDVVISAWDGQRIDLQDQLRELSGQLSLLAEQQLAYPVLHLFVSSHRSTSAPHAIAHLDDVLTLLDGVDQHAAPLPTARRQLRSALRAYVRTYGRDSSVDVQTPPPPPDTGRLAASGIPLLEPAAYSLAVSDLDGHRAAVHSLARSAGVDGR